MWNEDEERNRSMLSKLEKLPLSDTHQAELHSPFAPFLFKVLLIQQANFKKCKDGAHRIRKNRMLLRTWTELGLCRNYGIGMKRCVTSGIRNKFQR